MNPSYFLSMAIALFLVFAGVQADNDDGLPTPCSEYLLYSVVVTTRRSCGSKMTMLRDHNAQQYRRPVTTQQHILSDVQQHQQRYNNQQQPQQQQQQQQLPQPSFFVQQNPTLEVPQPRIQNQPQQQSLRFPQNIQQSQPQQLLRAPTTNISPQQDSLIGYVPNYVSNPQLLQQQPRTQQQQQQFQRSVHNQLQQAPFSTIPTPGVPQQQEQDIHTQNFLTLRNLGPQVGPQQSLPQRSFSNTLYNPLQPQFQNQPQQQQQVPQQIDQQFSTIPQFQHQNIRPTAQTEQKLPRQESNQQFSTSPQAIFNNQAYNPQPSHLPASSLLPYIPQPQLPPQNQQSQQISRPQQHPHYTNLPEIPPFDAPVVTPEQEYKQKLIQKHEQFVQKQYEKSQNKVKQLHEDFVHKQHTIKQDVPLRQSSQQSQGNAQRSRPVYASELNQFSEALKKYNIEHPTTTTTTTTQATTSSARPVENRQSRPDGERSKSSKTKKTIGRDELLKQLKAALAETPQNDLGDKPYETMDLVLPSGERVQVIRTQDPNLIKGQQAISQDQLNALIGSSSGGKQSKSVIRTVSDLPDKLKGIKLPDGVQIVKAPDSGDGEGGLDLSSLASLYGGGSSAVSSGGAGGNSIASSAVISSDSDEPPSIEELAKRGLIPDGYEIEGLSSKPKPAPAPTAPPKKKATYVYLEEQADGSFKIQGVKANGEKETKTTGAEVESILERIRSGEIKLPPSVTRLILPNDQEVTLDNGKIVQQPRTTTTTTTTTRRPPTSTTTTTTTTTTTPVPFIPTRPRVTVTRNSQPAYPTTVIPLNQRSSEGHLLQEASNSYRSTPDPLYQEGSISYVTTPQPIYDPSIQISSTYSPVTERLTATTVEQQIIQEAHNPPPNFSEDLIQIFKSNGLFAMAKYLKQSGLDSILNETGPYTIFVPTDKAFKNLLIQLGGPERAEEKFKSNPRLLSGLLLHHVIPGAFEISSLQDEMTGVSLAGTQLRVNQYTMHDQEWNDVLLTTINGAMVVNDRKDIKIPQGIAHAVDRVMFPLPVGDLLQTLQSDREARFATFLKVLFTSGLTEKLQGKGVKTFTVFAPTEKAFKELEPDVLEKLQTDKDAAEEFAMKHIVPGTLFSAGMRFYQVKDSLLTGKTVILQKTSAGKIKVNDAQMVTSNIPSTNGVIHAIDGILS
ncbi:putative mediator of RNA polymerase II transcription subunit 26 [Episyrphus balteatus]|uniref:putative mediator of RNA polymerase II transcription subunit 26 n=1 Tax=Episyrphus balteatus TaxID=286459 RepID=UPI0024857967|nr:putative mediator of RNA polymerase II transcription subunit 26 [Episyrphus balteatus]